jgi:hypothetical protein
MLIDTVVGCFGATGWNCGDQVLLRDLVWLATQRVLALVWEPQLGTEEMRQQCAAHFIWAEICVFDLDQEELPSGQAITVPMILGDDYDPDDPEEPELSEGTWFFVS